MSAQEDWFRFVISGRAEDYLKYAASNRKEYLCGGVEDAFYNRCSRNKGDEYRGTRSVGHDDDI